MNNPQNLTPMDGMKIGDLVNLTLGELDKYEVLRVHGGWLYTRMTLEPPVLAGSEPTIIVGSTVFVPEPPEPPQAANVVQFGKPPEQN